MEFFNPNVTADMAQILKDYQSKYVPCFASDNKKEVVATVPVHGDQLFEERARNVEWTFRDGQSSYDRLEGVPPEHADWHAKVTLYKVYNQFITNATELKTACTPIPPPPKKKKDYVQVEKESQKKIVLLLFVQTKQPSRFQPPLSHVMLITT